VIYVKNANFWLLGLAVLWLSGRSLAADLLTVGSDAPPLNIEHWVQDGNGKFKAVTKFAAGKVYVVEFWATWCPPCVASMPHLAELQANYATKGVQVVSISDEDLSTVERFLARTVPPAKDAEPEAKKQTYRELTSAYCLTTDPDGSSSTDYMQAAGIGGIPTAFIVGKDSKIEWIGHPMEIDQPLAAVVDDKWDRAAYLAVHVRKPKS
jgi:thiol-disulfide isomerase/thioredoxin